MPLFSKSVKKTTTTVVEENGKIVKTTVETTSEGDGEMQKHLNNVIQIVDRESGRAAVVLDKGLKQLSVSVKRIMQSLLIID